MASTFRAYSGSVVRSWVNMPTSSFTGNLLASCGVGQTAPPSLLDPVPRFNGTASAWLGAAGTSWPIDLETCAVQDRKAPMAALYHGWYVVAACATIACFSWGFAFYGLGVYLHALVRIYGWPTGAISIAVT